jgi:hypothetical protein
MDGISNLMEGTNLREVPQKVVLSKGGGLMPWE